MFFGLVFLASPPVVVFTATVKAVASMAERTGEVTVMVSFVPEKDVFAVGTGTERVLIRL